MTSHPAVPRRLFRDGVLGALPFLIVVTPFSMLFGVVATDAGLTLAQTMGFTMLVIAGAAQFAAIQLMTENAAVPLILLTALAVNLRMAMYSASLAPHLGAAPLWQRGLIAYANFDQTFALAIARYEAEPALPLRDKVRFFAGVATPITLVWCAMTAVGAVIGSSIPAWLALDFALPITFLALIGPMLRTLAHVAAAGTSVVVALLLAGLPAGVGLMIAAGAAMVAGATVETWMEGRGA